MLTEATIAALRAVGRDLAIEENGDARARLRLAALAMDDRRLAGAGYLDAADEIHRLVAVLGWSAVLNEVAKHVAA